MSAIVTSDYVLGPSPADWAQLEQPLSLDPVTFEIVSHKLESINEEQAIALKDVSVSPIVTAASDFNNALYTADGRIASMGRQVVFHSGAMPVILRHVMEAFPGEEIADGDMFVVNDPFYGAVHHPDVSLVAPLFHGEELIAWAGVAAHQVDMGGMSVGSISARAREKYQEGLMMPPMKLIEAGRLRRDVWRLILNMTRQPQMVGLDLRGFIASNAVARDRLAELIGRYGPDVVKTVMEELIRYSERRVRQRLRELPDGVFHTRGFLDHDGFENRVYRTDIRLEKDGDVLRFDMRDSSAQAGSYINCTEGALVGSIFGGTAPTLAAGIPWNHGILNALEVIAPPGLIVNAQRPAATGAATIGQGWTIMSVASHAVSKLLA
ncbi:MAG: hydantoinase B/oxoprolinase family protein, partial [Actinomycetota bacterium]|nr:hydantoinase B/oxoprolinase family protein [Actinomycetota bacterium]